MKAKEYFREINILKNRIEFKIEKAEFYKELSQNSAGVIYSDMPRPPKGKIRRPMEEALIKAIDLEIEVTKDREKLSRLIIEVMGYIEMLDDIKLQKILILRYLKNKIWKEIQKELNYSKGSVLNYNKIAISRLDTIISKNCT